MSDIKEIVKLATDAYHGNVTKYSVGESQDVLRQALVEANNGSTKLDYRAIRDGKCVGLFAIVEQVLANATIEGLQQSDFFTTFVDYRNIAEGDQASFYVEDSNLFVVSDTADGTQAIRRQRISGGKEVSIETTMHWVKIYEELNRVLSGRVDFNVMIQKVSQSFAQRILNDIYALWTSVTAEQLGGVTYFPVAGNYDTDTLLDVISHVEAAANGAQAQIIGTPKALRMLKDDLLSDGYKDDMYNQGYAGKFYGTPVMKQPQRHKINSTEFVMNDKALTIVAGAQKMIKFVYEGNPLVIMGNPIDNMDLTQELNSVMDYIA